MPLLIFTNLRLSNPGNEITAIPILLKMLQLKGAIVTIDAMGCQKAIAKQILEKEADYILNVKRNQPSLFEDIKLAFNAAKSQPQIIFSTNQTNDKGHGRIETRYYQTITDLSMIPAASAWQGARCVGSVISTREIGDKIETETRYFISSLSGDAQDLGRAVREHWGIENKAHWVLDVTFKEDASRIRKDFAAENMATARRIALNLLERDTSKGSIKGKRKKAAWNNEFLIKILLGI